MLVERRGHGEIAQLDAEVYAADDFHGVLAFLAARDVEHKDDWLRACRFANRLYVKAWWKRAGAIDRIIFGRG